MNKSVLTAVIFCLGVFFALLAIIVPSSIASHGLVVINEGDDIKPNGQMKGWLNYKYYKLHLDWYAEYAPEGDNRLKVYHVPDWNWMDLPTINRFYDSNRSVTLNRDLFAVGFNVAGPTRISLTMDCTSENVHTYVLSETEYKNAVGSKGKVDTSKIEDQERIRDKCLASGEVFSKVARGDSYWYLVISNTENTDVTVNFHYSLNYTVYDMHDRKALECQDHTCKIANRIFDHDLVIIDYPCEGKDCPKSIKARIFTDHPNKVAIAVTATIFSVLAVALIVAGFILLIKKGKNSEYLLINREQPEKAILTITV